MLKNIDWFYENEESASRPPWWYKYQTSYEGTEYSLA